MQEKLYAIILESSLTVIYFQMKVLLRAEIDKNICLELVLKFIFVIFIRNCTFKLTYHISGLKPELILTLFAGRLKTSGYLQTFCSALKSQEARPETTDQQVSAVEQGLSTELVAGCVWWAEEALKDPW